MDDNDRLAELVDKEDGGLVRQAAFRARLEGEGTSEEEIDTLIALAEGDPDAWVKARAERAGDPDFAKRAAILKARMIDGTRNVGRERRS